MHRNYFFLKQLTIKVINHLEGKFLSGKISLMGIPIINLYY